MIAGQTEGSPGPSFFDLAVGYWTERKRANFLMVHFNDLLEDLDTEMRRVTAFLEIEINETLWPSLVTAAGFKEMQESGEALIPELKVSRTNGAQSFFYRGTNGRWRGVLTDDDLAHYDAKVREKFTPGLAAWLEGGRRASGEPREIAD